LTVAAPGFLLDAGFHYRFSTRVGQDMGRKIGRFVVDTVMKPATVAVAR
jgi:hypothetical protein